MHRAIKCRFGKKWNWAANFFNRLLYLSRQLEFSPKLEFYVRCVQIFKTRHFLVFQKKECRYKRVLLQPQFLISFCINEYKNGNMCGWLTLEFFSLTHNSFLQPFVSRDFSNNYFHSHTSLHYYVMNEMKAHNNKINLLEN